MSRKHQLTHYREQLEQELLDEEKDTLLKQASPALRDKLEWINDWFRAEARRGLQSRLELARQIEEVHQDVTRNHGSRYGANAMETIELCFPWARSTIYQARRLAAAFTAEEMEALCQRQLPDGEPLTYSHAHQLASITDRGKRQELIEQTASEGLSARELACIVHQIHPEPTKPDCRGRPLAVPRNIRALVEQQVRIAEDFLKRSAEVWEKADFDALSQKASPDLPGRLAKLRDTMTRLASKAAEHARVAEMLCTRFRQMRLTNKHSVTPPEGEP